MRVRARLATSVVVAVLASGCISHPRIETRRLQNDVYLISSDRCAVLGDELERDIHERATGLCRHGVAQIGEFRSLPSSQGSLLGECLHSGKLQAQVTCHRSQSRP